MAGALRAWAGLGLLWAWGLLAAWPLAGAAAEDCPPGGGYQDCRQVQERAALAGLGQGQPAPAAAAQVERLAGGDGLRASLRRADGSLVVLCLRRFPDGQRMVFGYVYFRDAAAGTRTRLYTSGRKVTVGHDFVMRAAPGQPTRVIHRHGLRECFLPGGQPVAVEEMVSQRLADGGAETLIQRTVLAVVVAGQALALETPVVQRYRLEPVGGVRVYAYLPVRLEPWLYEALARPFPSPLVVSPPCAWCPPPVAAFAQPTALYQDPLALLGDLQIAGAIADGLAQALPAGCEVWAGQAQADQADLAAGLDDLAHELALAAAPGLPEAWLAAWREHLQPPLTGPPVISQELRRQMRQQVEQDIMARHESGAPLSLGAILASGGASDYLFQVAEVLDAADETTGEECALSTGDLLRLAQVPPEAQPSARMLVALAKPGGCRVGSVVPVSLTYLQDMLNASSQRLEVNIGRLSQRLSSDRDDETSRMGRR
ncbi:MAG: hypothetical protein V1806_12135 [Pseudomonadota bacterium]